MIKIASPFSLYLAFISIEKSIQMFSSDIKVFVQGRGGGGLVFSALAFHSRGLSSNPAGYLSFFVRNPKK